MNSEIVREGVAAGICDAVEENQNRGLALTPRDHFAIGALQGLLSTLRREGSFDQLSSDNDATLARNAYELADAMLKAREVKTVPSTEPEEG